MPTAAEIAGWLIDVAADEVPTVSFVGEPRATHRGVLRIDLEAGDDYGVAELALLLVPWRGARARPSGWRCSSPADQPAKVATGSYLDLTAHPWPVCRSRCSSRLSTRSARRGQSDPLEITLPEREFRHPLARAGDRAAQAVWWLHPRSSEEVAGSLAALGDTPAAQQLPTAVPLTLAGCSGTVWR